MNKKLLIHLILVAAIAVPFSSCSKNKDKAGQTLSSSAPNELIDSTLIAGADVESEITPLLIRSKYEVAGPDRKIGEVTTMCAAAISAAQKSIDSIVAIAPQERTIDNTLLALEYAMSDLGDITNPLTFMGYVSTNEEINGEGSACEQELGAFYVKYSSRTNLYEALVGLKGRNAAEKRLLAESVRGFEQSGINLSKEVRDQLEVLNGDLSKLTSEFASNLNSDSTRVLFSAEELNGVPENFLEGLKKEGDKFIVTTKSTNYVMVMENAVNADTRKKMLFTYQQQGQNNGLGKATNTELLEKAIEVRAQIAKLMGRASWADYRTSNRMVKNKETALGFLNKLRTGLAERNKADLDRLLAAKKAKDPAATEIYPWDNAFYSNQVMKEKYALDTEVIRQYFPAHIVVKGMFEVYESMLGVIYKEVKDPAVKVWADDVKLYAIHNKLADGSEGKVIAYFYTDFTPRQGKYGHAAAFTLIAARKLPNGKYILPVSSIVANFTPPNEKGFSFLDHDEVDTLFHEFGHIMHQTLSRAPYASLAGTSVVQDFVEAPSQMLENWVWSKPILEKLSGRAEDPSIKLPAEIIDKMIEAKDFNQGLGFTKQLLYSTFDMEIHSQAPGTTVDVTKTYDRLYKEIVGKDPIADGHFAASFGHLMGGYDAGYYGYLWSQVYADDMFTKFSKENLMDPVVGARYRKEILEYGNMKDASELLQNFLQRAPSTDSFFRKLGLIAESLF